MGKKTQIIELKLDLSELKVDLAEKHIEIINLRLLLLRHHDVSTIRTIEWGQECPVCEKWRIAECDHDWVDVKNEVVESGWVCSKCGKIRCDPRR